MAKKTRRAAAADASAGENPRRPCPCGSGKRYKACHGAGDDVIVTRPFAGLAAECELVAMREVDFGVTLSPTHAAGTAVRSLTQTEMICIAPPGHPLLARPVVTPAEIAAHTLISFGSDTHFGRLLDQVFEEAGVKREVAIQVTMSLVAACFVQTGAGVAVVDSFMRHLGFPGVEWRRFLPRVLLPATLPAYMVGLRSGLGLGWMFVIAAEFMGASEGLGFLLIDGQMTGRPQVIIGAIILFALFGKATDLLLAAASKRVLFWQDAFDPEARVRFDADDRERL